MTMNVVVANNLVVGCLGGKKIESLLLGATEHEGGKFHSNDGAVQHEFWCKNACHGVFSILPIFQTRSASAGIQSHLFFPPPAEPF